MVWVQHNSDDLPRDGESWQYGPELVRRDSPDKVIAHTNLYWQCHKAPGRTAGMINTADVDFAERP